MLSWLSKKTGGVEVPQSDEHPWGVDDGIRMPVPLDFAWMMRQDKRPDDEAGAERYDKLLKKYGDLNKEFPQFVAGGVYNLVPSFINDGNFHDNLPEFIIHTVRGTGRRRLKKIHVYNKLELVEVSKFESSIIRNFIELTRLFARKPGYNEVTPDNYKTIVDGEYLLHLKLRLSKLTNLAYMYPNILQFLDTKFPGSVQQIYDSLTYINAECQYTDNPFIKLFIHYQKHSISKVKFPDSQGDLEKYIDDRKKSEHKILMINENIWLNDKLDFAYELVLKPFQQNKIIITDLGKSLTSDYQYSMIPINFISSIGGHAVSLVLDHKTKITYISDSNGITPCKKNITVYLIDKLTETGYNTQRWFGPRETVYIFEPKSCPSGGFQAISENNFCQTWFSFISLLILRNARKYSESRKSVDEFIFKNIIDHAKPILGYHEDMSARDRLSLIIVEYMYYISWYFEDDVYNFLAAKTEWRTHEHKRKIAKLQLQLDKITNKEYKALLAKISAAERQEAINFGEKLRLEYPSKIGKLKYVKKIPEEIKTDLETLPASDSMLKFMKGEYR